MSELKIVKASTDLKVTDFEYGHVEQPYSVSRFVKMEGFKYNDPIQRGCVWSLQQKSDLIHTILAGLMMPPVIAEKITKNKKVIRNIIDGKQRLTTIRDFVKNLFVLVDIPPILSWNGDEMILVDVNGLKYDELPVSFKDKINAFTIRVIELEIEDEDMKRMIFRKLNHGKQLNPHQKIKSSMSYSLLSFVAEMCKSPVFKLFLNDTAINNEEHGKLVQQSLRLLYTEGDTDLTSKTIEEFVESGAADDEQLQNDLKDAFDRISNSVKLLDEKQIKKVLNKLKFQSLVLAAKKANEYNMDDEEFANWMVAFFITDYKKHSFSQHASGSTTKREKVRGRTDETMKHFDKFATPTE